MCYNRSPYSYIPGILMAFFLGFLMYKAVKLIDTHIAMQIEMTSFIKRMG